ncbi:hypothetical protein EJ05DRAFT_352092 [Pseudovirgaria hyperparasitica]|uniref:Uncharacterized protein n=1 Tax=Pseudovirgaria hyperparasitica TaxID=470096 RepID=A0A6A6W955_9PEZI|nr:uncharacterized protein EJ05DRAFT_352092 [Pseudovirgaria hyperparasitica]KAF2758470.1 hypothetical protein EJ05DRAFT_352092 [Pseudovirgaria hyperparasitica]
MRSINETILSVYVSEPQRRSVGCLEPPRCVELLYYPMYRSEVLHCSAASAQRGETGRNYVQCPMYRRCCWDVLCTRSIRSIRTAHRRSSCTSPAQQALFAFLRCCNLHSKLRPDPCLTSPQKQVACPPHVSNHDRRSRVEVVSARSVGSLLIREGASG